jgi:preprotein translocase subunit SecD
MTRYRFAEIDTQLKARDIIQAKVGQNYVVALSLVPDSPHWLQVLGAKPMYLGSTCAAACTSSSK